MRQRRISSTGTSRRRRRRGRRAEGRGLAAGAARKDELWVSDGRPEGTRAHAPVDQFPTATAKVERNGGRLGRPLTRRGRFSRGPSAGRACRRRRGGNPAWLGPRPWGGSARGG